MRSGDYDEMIDLWKSCQGMGLSSADTREAIEAFLLGNPGLSFVARDGQSLVGTVLTGSDQRRGFLYHVAVKPSHRRMGIANRLVDHAMAALKAAGIEKVHIMVFADNQPALDFWQQTGWVPRTDLVLLSKVVE